MFDDILCLTMVAEAFQSNTPDSGRAVTVIRVRVSFTCFSAAFPSQEETPLPSLCNPVPLVIVHALRGLLQLLLGVEEKELPPSVSISRLDCYLYK